MKKKTIFVLENSYFEDKLNLLENKKLISLFSHHCLTVGNSDIAVPVASFMKKVVHT